MRMTPLPAMARLLRRARLVLDADLVLGTLFDRLSAAHGEGRVVQEADGGATLTYPEVAERVARMAGGIRPCISPGDPVVVATANGYDLLLLSLAVCRAGGVAVPVNPKMRDDEIAHVVDDSGARLIVRDAEEVAGAEPVEASPSSPADVAAIFYTSGTTGRPKGAKLSHRALLGAGPLLAAYPSGLRRDEAVCGLPVAHIAGFTLLLVLACAGIPVHLLVKFRPDRALDAIESRRATIFIGVPAMYRMMLEAGAEERDLRSVRLWASGADTMPDEIMARFKAMGASATLPLLHTSLGQAAFVDGYGMVELAGAVGMRFSPPLLTLPFVGRLLVPLPSYHLGVVGDDGGPVRLGQVGELVVKGAGVMEGYHGNPVATGEAMAGGWLRTGDLARRAPFGLIELAGRMKDVIKHGGYSVFAVEVQHALEQHPAVAEAAVLGLPDERKGEVPVAVVRLHRGAGVGEAELIAWAGEHMADYKVPRRVEFLDELPRTGTDKVQKAELRPLFATD